jgi:hypothetical protein
VYVLRCTKQLLGPFAASLALCLEQACQEVAACRSQRLSPVLGGIEHHHTEYSMVLLNSTQDGERHYLQQAATS